MDFSDIERRGLVLLGCGKMGSAMLAGWLGRGLSPAAVWVRDPDPSDWVRGQGVQVNATLPEAPAVVLVAVKPQMMAEALPVLAPLGEGDTLFLSVAAGTPIATYEDMLGAGTPITAIVGNARASAAQMDLAEALLKAIGAVVRLDHEGQMDAVTGVSGSGPAYVFHMIEALAAAGTAQGLDEDLAMELAKATVAGAGALAMQSGEDPGQLRVNVTSPNGTTQAGLEVLMDDATGLPPLMAATVRAAAERSRELARG